MRTNELRTKGTDAVLAPAREAGVRRFVAQSVAAGPVREWLPVLAQAVGAKPPRRVPTWLGRLFAGEAAVVMDTEARGASNAKAKRELGWTPRHPSWREGFPAAYSATSVADRPKPHPAARASRSAG